VLNSKLVPTSSLFVKDHKPKNACGDFPTRLLILAQNFVAMLPTLGYKAIRHILDSSGTHYMKYTNVHSYNLKLKLEALNL